uniref:Uncharacterized protein n=1 Tax=Anguilla anguilla TaxID=7936 RepID=A0A0E9V342_ANGAN
MRFTAWGPWSELLMGCGVVRNCWIQIPLCSGLC